MTLSGPNTLMPLGLVQDNSSEFYADGDVFPKVITESNLEIAMEGADVVMALRLQSERQNAGYVPTLREYIRRWQITEQRLNKANPNVLVMHPGPMNEGVEISTEVAHGRRSIIEEQVTNGVALRMAVLYQMAMGVNPSLTQED